MSNPLTSANHCYSFTGSTLINYAQNGIPLTQSSSNLLRYATKGAFGLLALNALSRHRLDTGRIATNHDSEFLCLQVLLYSAGICCIGPAKPTVKKVAKVNLMFLLWGSIEVSDHLFSGTTAGLMTKLAIYALQGTLLSCLFRDAIKKKPKEETFAKVIVLPKDLRKCTMIPELLTEYPKLQARLCPIGIMPIRDPVKDPRDGKIYERSNLIRALQNETRSPCTGLPLSVSELIECPTEKEEIDAELLRISKHLENVFKKA